MFQLIISLTSYHTTSHRSPWPASVRAENDLTNCSVHAEKVVAQLILVRMML